MGILTIRTASELGAILDCDLNTGFQVVNGVITSNAATDNTAILNAFLALGTAANPVKLIMDGGSVVSGLFLPTLGHASIEGFGWDTGFWQKSGGNNDTIHNGGLTAAIPTDPISIGVAAPTTFGFNVMLRNFRINGNRGNGLTGNSNSGNPKGNTLNPATLYFGINLMNLKNIRIENIWIYDTATYAIRTSNCAEMVIEGVRIEAPSIAQNTDGIHLSGPHSDVRISTCYFQTGDDAIALNAPEGYGGNMTRIAVSNCVYFNASVGIRAYVGISTTFTISKVVMTNCTGNFVNNALPYNFAVLLGNTGAGIRNVDQIQDFTISNCTFTMSGNAPIAIADSCGTVNIDNVTWKDPNTGTGHQGFISLIGQCNVSSLNVTDCKIYRSTLGNSAVIGLWNGGGNNSGSSLSPCTIGVCNFSGFNIVNESGQSYPAIANLILMSSLTISELIIDSIDPTLITALVDTFTGVTLIRGVGLSQTTFALPDSIVANDCPYVSATTNLLSVKIGGIVQAYFPNLGSGGTPTIANGAAAGTAPGTPTVVGSNTAGVITVTTGTATTASATLATVTFSGTLPKAPSGVVLFPQGANAAGQVGMIFTTAPTTTGFTIGVAGSPLPVSTTYTWNYLTM